MNFNYDKLVGLQIRRIRMEQGLTQDQLAAKLQVANCNITRSALAKIEAGQRHIYVDEIKCIKEILKTDYKDLLI